LPLPSYIKCIGPPGIVYETGGWRGSEAGRRPAPIHESGNPRIDLLQWLMGGIREVGGLHGPTLATSDRGWKHAASPPSLLRFFCETGRFLSRRLEGTTGPSGRGEDIPHRKIGGGMKKGSMVLEGESIMSPGASRTKGPPRLIEIRRKYAEPPWKHFRRQARAIPRANSPSIGNRPSSFEAFCRAGSRQKEGKGKAGPIAAAKTARRPPLPFNHQQSTAPPQRRGRRSTVPIRGKASGTVVDAQGKKNRKAPPLIVLHPRFHKALHSSRISPKSRIHLAPIVAGVHSFPRRKQAVNPC